MPRKRQSKHVETKNPKPFGPRHFNHHWASGELAAPNATLLYTGFYWCFRCSCRSLAWLPCCLGNFGLLKTWRSMLSTAKNWFKKNEKNIERNISLKSDKWHSIQLFYVFSIFRASPGGPWWRHPATLRRKVAVATKDHLATGLWGNIGRPKVVTKYLAKKTPLNNLSDWILLIIFFERFKRYREREKESRRMSVFRSSLEFLVFL